MDAIGLTVIATRTANRLTHNTVACRRRAIVLITGRRRAYRRGA
jgi:hypothetical protein